MEPVPSLLSRLIPLLQLGFAIGLLRYTCEFIAPDRAMYFGLYYLMPLAFLVIGLRGTWGAISWKSVAVTMLVTALLCWGLANTAAYTTAQFMEWSHGRFAEGRAMPPADSTAGKIGLGLLQGLLTAVAGSVWCIVFGTLFIWIPTRMRARQA